jgi:hypothetical protein
LQVAGLGSASLSVIYFFLIISSLFIPSFVIEKLTAKWTIVVSMLCYSGYILAQFYPSFYTLMPAAALVGIAAAPLWIAKCAYLTQASRLYFPGFPVPAFPGIPAFCIFPFPREKWPGISGN